MCVSCVRSHEGAGPCAGGTADVPHSPLTGQTSLSEEVPWIFISYDAFSSGEVHSWIAVSGESPV